MRYPTRNGAPQTRSLRRASLQHGVRARWHPLRFLRAHWLPYLVVLPVGAVIVIVVAVLTAGGEDDDAPEARQFVHLHLDGVAHPHGGAGVPGASPLDEHPLERALGALVEPEPGLIPPSAAAAGSHTFLGLLFVSRDPHFDAWSAYMQVPGLLALQGWREGEGVEAGFASTSLYPAADAQLAAAAFESLRRADGAQILSITDANLELEAFQRLADPGLGDESLAYRIRHQVRGQSPAAARDTTVIWVRVGGSVFFSARSEFAHAGAEVPAPEAVDIEALVRSLAARVAAFDPAAPASPSASPDDAEGGGA